MRVISVDALSELFEEPIQVFLSRLGLKCPPIIELEQNWISCKEKLPPNEKKTYWVCLGNGSQCECRWTNDIYGFGEIEDRWGWSYLDKPQYSTIVAWRELPEPMRLENK